VTVIYLLATIFLLGGACLRVAEVRRAWRDAGWQPTKPLVLWQVLLGRTVARGLDRAVVAQAIIVCSGAIIMAAETVSNWIPAVAAERLRAVGVTGGALGIVVGTAMAFMIVLANRPAVVVPPSCRHEAGVLTRR
jgi:hypothetical protein